ncbi:MAG: hypothetical protein Q9215_000218 [Flavoplaca cf. flavocitrina]
MASSPEKSGEVTLREGTDTTDLAFPFDDTITVYVGPDNERFSIHKRLICQYSFFEAAFNGHFQESAAGVVKLPEHDATIFRFFVYWLYTGKLDGHFYPASAKPSLSDARKECKLGPQPKYLPHYMTKCNQQLGSAQAQLYILLTYRDAPFDALIGLYLLAEYLQVHDLRDQIINVLVDVYAYSQECFEGVLTSFWRWRNCTRPHWAPDPVPTINAAWKSAKALKLCRLLVKLFCDNVISDAETLQENERLDADFLNAAYTMAQERWLRSTPRMNWANPGAICPFHDHDGKACEFHNEKLAKAEI